MNGGQGAVTESLGNKSGHECFFKEHIKYYDTALYLENKKEIVLIEAIGS